MSLMLAILRCTFVQVRSPPFAVAQPRFSIGCIKAPFELAFTLNQISKVIHLFVY